MQTNSETTPFEVEEPADLLIALLYAPGKSGRLGEPIVGTTRLQKLFFLLNQGEGPETLVEEAKRLGFEPYKMGPYSKDLRDIVADLEAADIIEAVRLEYRLPDDQDDPGDGEGSADGGHRKVTSFSYRLSGDLGMLVGADLWAGLPSQAQEGLTEFKRFFNSISLRQLLIFTYERFPEYTARSTIKDQLGF